MSHRANDRYWSAGLAAAIVIAVGLPIAFVHELGSESSPPTPVAIGAPEAPSEPSDEPSLDAIFGLSAAAPAAETVEAERGTESEELPSRPRPSRAEREYYEHFAVLIDDDTRGLEKIVAEVLHKEGPDCEKVALLRALYELKSELAYDAFITAIEELPDEHRPQGIAIPSFAVQYLGERSRGDGAAWDALEWIVWKTPRPIEPDLRRRAASHLAAHGTGEEVHRMLDPLRREADNRLLETVRVGLQRNRAKVEVDHVFGQLGWQRTTAVADDEAEEGESTGK